MRQSNVCSPAQNQACLLITSRLYDRRGQYSPSYPLIIIIRFAAALATHLIYASFTRADHLLFALCLFQQYSNNSQIIQYLKPPLYLKPSSASRACLGFLLCFSAVSCASRTDYLPPIPRKTSYRILRNSSCRQNIWKPQCMCTPMRRLPHRSDATP